MATVNTLQVRAQEIEAALGTNPDMATALELYDELGAIGATLHVDGGALDDPRSAVEAAPLLTDPETQLEG
jgi:hypothetical protein